MVMAVSLFAPLASAAVDPQGRGSGPGGLSGAGPDSRRFRRGRGGTDAERPLQRLRCDHFPGWPHSHQPPRRRPRHPHHGASRGPSGTARHLVGTDALSDLAVLKIDRKDLRNPDAPLPVAKFGDSSALEVGDVVLAMGSPAGLSQSVTQGIVANTEMISPGGSMRLDGEAVGELVRWIGHDAVIFPGNSGGPLVNLKGEIVGVNEVGIGSLGGAIPSNLAKKVSDELIATGRVRRSWIGLNAQPLLKSSDAKAGILVGGVIGGSPADAAGLKAGDIITRCNGTEIAASRAPEDIPVFNRMLLETPVGSEIASRRHPRRQADHLEGHHHRARTRRTPRKGTALMGHHRPRSHRSRRQGTSPRRQRRGAGAEPPPRWCGRPPPSPRSCRAI